jgi:UPF0716 protein FxsA
MHLGKHPGTRSALGLLLLPIVEIAVFLLIAWAIGFGPTLAAMVLTSVAGGFVLYGVGRGAIAQAGEALRAGAGGRAGSGRGDHLMRAIAGILLVLPGFVTDLAGACLLIGPLRRRIGAAFGRAARKPGRGPGTVIDLEPQEWRRIADRKRPQRKAR